jgi:hypothetical protein
MVSLGIKLSDYPNHVGGEEVEIEELVASIHALVTTCTAGTAALGSGMWMVDLQYFKEEGGGRPGLDRRISDARGPQTRGHPPDKPTKRQSDTFWAQVTEINGQYDLLSLSLPVLGTVFGHAVTPLGAEEPALLQDGAENLFSQISAAMDTADTFRWTSGTGYDISVRVRLQLLANPQWATAQA